MKELRPFAEGPLTRAASRPSLVGLTLLVGAALVPALSSADSESEARYPFDPACPWGRVGNGRGMLVRCLTEEEAKSVVGGDPRKSTPRGALPAEGKPADKPAVEPTVPPTEEPADFTLSVGPIVADEGEISLGALSKPLDRYRACVEENGGLKGSSGKVVIEFLVRGERRRAEGAEVASFAGVTKQAARCLAEVVDRRATGTPSAAMTGVALTFELKKKP